MGIGWFGWLGQGEKGVSGRWMPCCARDPRNRIVGASKVRIPYFLLCVISNFSFFVLPDSAGSGCLCSLSRLGGGLGGGWMGLDVFCFWEGRTWLCVWRR